MKTKDELEDALATWRKLNEFARFCTEEDALKAMEYETTHKKRFPFIRRLHCRLNYLRGMRERKELDEKYNNVGL